LTGKKAASKWPLQIVDGVPDPGTDCFHKDAENGIDVRSLPRVTPEPPKFCYPAPFSSPVRLRC